MPKLMGLSNSRVHRRVREVVENGEETIYVYEPSVDDVEAIIEMQDVLAETYGDVPTEVVISGSDVVRKVFPMLTNIDGIEELTDEQIDEIIANPTIALLQVQNVIETIITQIYKTVILSAKKRMLEADFDAASLSVLDGIISQTAGLQAKTDEKVVELQEKFTTQADNVISMLNKRKTGEVQEESVYKAEEVKAEETVVDEPKEMPEVVAQAPTQTSPVDKYQDKLSAYLESFSKED